MTTRTTPCRETQSAESDPITGEEFHMMNDIGPAELVEGKIVRMTPTTGQHGHIESKLARFIGNYVEDHRLGWVLVGEVGMYTGRDPDTVRGADVMFLSKERLPAGPPEKFIDIAPNLIVEIVSPSNTWTEMRRKIDEYFDTGVDRVWIVEPETKSVLVYRDSTTIEKYEAGDVVTGGGELEGFEISVDDIFAV